MKILYIQPWNYAAYRQIERYQKGYLKKLSIPRVMLEVLFYAADLAEIEILDLNLELLENPKKTVSELLNNKLHNKIFDVILLTYPAVALGNQIGDLIIQIKKSSPATPILVGGEAVELMQEDILKFWPADYVYDGYGSEIADILGQIKQPQLKNIPGLYYRQGNEIIIPQIKKGRAALLDDYDPEQFYSVKGQLDFKAYLKRYESLDLEPTAFIEMTRGCSHKCTFCAINKNKNVLTRSPSTVAAETEFLLKSGINDFYLIDPTLGLKKNATEKLLIQLTAIKQKYPNLNILGVTRTDMITPYFAKKLKTAGFNMIGLGIETMTEQQLGKIKKKTIPDNTKPAVKLLNQNNICSKLFLIHFPHIFSTETIKFLLDLTEEKIDFIVQSSFYRPLYEKKAYSEAPDFRRFDQRIDCRSLNLDSSKSIVEWMMCNLTFPSTDVNTAQGDTNVLKTLAEADLANIKIPGQFTSLILLFKNKYYLYQPGFKIDYLKQNLWVGSDINKVKITDEIIIDFSQRR